jgi:cytochrome c2
MDQGVLLRFDVPLDSVKARDPNSYSLQSWSYRRTFQYGSAQYRDDGTTGQDERVASSAYVASDARSVFIGVPGMKPVMQLRVDWSLATAEGKEFSGSAHTTPYELIHFDPKAEGFGDIMVDLTPRAAAAASAAPITVEEGKRVAQAFSCIACHATEKDAVIKSGPTWKGLFGSQHTVYVGGKVTRVTADENYLRESIREPNAKLAENFEKGEFAMPSFAGVLTQAEIESLILYIKSLR